MNLDDLAALSVAHDALIEGRDTCSVLADSPLWARADRLLPAARWGTSKIEDIRNDLVTFMKAAYGATLETSTKSMMGSMLTVYSEQIIKLYEQIQKQHDEALWNLDYTSLTTK